MEESATSLNQKTTSMIIDSQLILKDTPMFQERTLLGEENRGEPPVEKKVCTRRSGLFNFLNIYCLCFSYI